MPMRDAIVEKLTRRFAPDFLEVIDESHTHAGHAGWREGGETHFRVRIATRHFDGVRRLAQHRAVMDALGEEFAAGLHALALEILPPGGPYERPARV